MAERCHVLFTDLDGTLLDHHTYQPGPALAALRELQNHGVAVIPATSKTAAELRPLVRDLGLCDGWIAENGGVVEMPAKARALRLGLAYGRVRQELADSAREVDAVVRGFGDMDQAEVAQRTGLSLAAAGAARCREWTESFVLLRGDLTALRTELARRGIRVVRGGRFLTASGARDKGTAVRAVLSGLRATSWAVGDAANDAAMLAAVDHPLLVRAHHGGWADLDVPGLTRVDGVGPFGFIHAARRILAGVGPPRGHMSGYRSV